MDAQRSRYKTAARMEPHPWRSTAPCGEATDRTQVQAERTCGDKMGTEEFTVEAKQDVKLSYPGTPKSLGPCASTQLAWASAQCSTDNHGGPNRMAMVFIVPSLKKPPADESFAEWTAAISNFPADLKAHYLNAPAPQSVKNRRFFPGVILLGRLVPPKPSPDG